MPRWGSHPVDVCTRVVFQASLARKPVNVEFYSTTNCFFFSFFTFKSRHLHHSSLPPRRLVMVGWSHVGCVFSPYTPDDAALPTATAPAPGGDGDPVLEASRENRARIQAQLEAGGSFSGPTPSKNRHGRAVREVPSLSFGEFMNPLTVAAELGERVTGWVSSLVKSSGGGGDDAAAKTNEENEKVAAASKPRPIASDSPAGLARQRGALLFMVVPLMLGLFFILPAVEREEQYVEAELAVEQKENHRFVEDEKMLVAAEHMVAESVTVADNPDSDGDGTPDGVEMHPNQTAVIALENDMARDQGQAPLDANLTTPPSPPLPPLPPSFPPPPMPPQQIPREQCTAALRAAQLEYFKAHYCQYSAGVTFADPANPADQSTLEEQAVRAYIQVYAGRGGKGAPDIPAAAAAEEAAGMLPHAVFNPKSPPVPAPIEAQYQDPPPEKSLASTLFGGRRRLLKKRAGGGGGKTKAQRGAGGNVVAVAVGESTLSFALAAASAMEDANLPGIARLFEGSPEAYVRLEHVKRKIAQFQSGRLRLVGSFVGKDRGEVDMAPPAGISDQEWVQTSFFGDGHHVDAVPDNLRLSQITPATALSGGTPLVMSIDPELTAGVLEGMETSLVAGNPRALLLTADRIEFGQAFSQRYPYRVYALAPPDATTGGMPRMFRVDHEAWDPVMQEIRGLERVTLMAVAKDDPFNARVEAEQISGGGGGDGGDGGGASVGMAACRCSHVVHCAGMTGYATFGRTNAVNVASVTGNNDAKTPQPLVTDVSNMRVDGTAPCKQSASEHLKYREYFAKGKKGRL